MMGKEKILEHEISFDTIGEANFSEVQMIYEQGLRTRNATFESTVPDWSKWNQSHLSHSRIAVMYQNQMIGWGSLSAISERCVYAGVAEISVYVHADYWERGIGSIIMQKLIDESEKNGIWSLMSGVFPENEASIRIHLKEGFRIVGTREKIGKLDDVWRDTILLQRRSKIVGID
jgi:L-amino acid N-acyltransferase YncA